MGVLILLVFRNMPVLMSVQRGIRSQGGEFVSDAWTVGAPSPSRRFDAGSGPCRRRYKRGTARYRAPHFPPGRVRSLRQKTDFVVKVRVQILQGALC